MTRETQSYVVALTSSRDQLRGHLAVLGDTLASTHDLDRILRVILHSAVAATGARSGAVLLVEEDGVLVGRCMAGPNGTGPDEIGSDEIGSDEIGSDESRLDGTGLDGTGPDESRLGADGRVGAGTSGPGELALLRVPVGSGILGAVAATGEPRRGRTEAGDELPGEPAGRSYLAVPFAAPGPATADTSGRAALTGPATADIPGRAALTGPATADTLGGAALAGEAAPGTLGVLVLYDRLGADGFDDDDLATLRTFAGHAAVAVENVRLHEEAQRLSLTDPLTGLWNYRYLHESIRREVERASRFRRMLSVLALDLDLFKTVNDTYGHAVGDAVLVEFARRVRGEIREVDLAFRQGGEEFVLLLPETDARGAAILAERLGAVVRDSPIVTESHSGLPDANPVRIPVTVSVGIAVYPDHASTAQQVLDAADEALYAAKAAGRDTYRVAPVPVRPATEEITVRAAAVPPEDGMPRAGAGGGVRHVPDGGASSGPHPPRQSRGR
nr:diguanylate cyclase [Micromonospora pallida]